MLDQVAHRASDWAAIFGLGGTILGGVGSAMGVIANIRSRIHRREAMRWRKRHKCAMRIAKYWRSEANHYMAVAEDRQFREMPE